MFHKLTIPQRAHPLIKRMYELMNVEKVSLLTVANSSGVHKDTINNWRRRGAPRVDMLEACLNVIGYRLTIEKIPMSEAAE